MGNFEIKQDSQDLLDRWGLNRVSDPSSGTYHCLPKGSNVTQAYSERTCYGPGVVLIEASCIHSKNRSRTIGH
jgi:hypothetical protein